MNTDVYATFDSTKEYTVALKGGVALNWVQIYALRTDEHGRILSLLAKQNPTPEGASPELVINWDNVLYVQEAH